jgi:hypothetical protein
VELASAGFTSERLDCPLGIDAFPFRSTTTGKTGRSEVDITTNDTVAAPCGVAFERREEVRNQMGPTDPITTPAADAASVLEHELRRMFDADGVIDFQERRLLKLSGALTRETNRVDASLRVIVSAFRIDGLRGPTFRRRLREFDRDWEPDPAGPAAAKREAA